MISFEYLDADETPKKKVIEDLKKKVEKIEKGENVNDEPASEKSKPAKTAKTTEEIPDYLAFPKKPKGKAPVSIRFPPEVLDYFQAMGPGWQTKINEVLIEHITNQKLKLGKD